MGLSYVTAFPLTENPMSEGSRWIQGGATGLLWNNIRTTPGLAFGTQVGLTAGFDDSIAILKGSWDPTQVVECVAQPSTNPITVTDTGHVFEEIEILLRFAISANSATGYELTISMDPNDDYVQINRWNGTLGGFTLLANGTSGGISAGTAIKGTICGSHICLYINGILKLSFDDTTYATGAPGIGHYFKNNDGRGTYADSDYGWESADLSNNRWAYGANTIAQASATLSTTWSPSAFSAAIPAGLTAQAIAFCSKSGGAGTLPKVNTITDNKGNVWYCDWRIGNNNGTYGSELSGWHAVSVGGTAPTLTLTFSQSLASGAGAQIIAWQTGGLSLAPGAAVILDFFQAAVDSTSPMNSGSSVGTTDRKNEMKVGAYGDAGNIANLAVSSPDANMNLIAKVEASTIGDIIAAYGDAGAAGSTAQTTFTSSVNAEALVAVAVYRSIEPSTGVREAHVAFPKPRLRG